MIRYFKTIHNQNGFEEIDYCINHHFKILKNEDAVVLHMMEGNHNLQLDTIIEFIKLNNFKKVIIDFVSVETYVDTNIIEYLEKNIHNVKLRILSCNILNNKFSSHRFFSNHIAQLYEEFFELFDATCKIQFRILNTKKRLKKYLFLNHHLRTERFKIFESLFLNNNLDDGLVSFNWNLENENFNAQHYQVTNEDMFYINNSPAYSLIPIELDGNLNKKPNPFNITNEIQNPVHFAPPQTNVVHYYETYFEIITEGFSSSTPYHSFVDRNNLLHYSEKIWKPLFFGLPFCFWGPENTLNELKKYFDFKFDCPLYYCNEGYDLNLFCDKVNELASLSYEELHNMYYAYFKDFEHNQSVLKNYIKNLYL